MKFTILLLFLGLMSHSQSDNINWNSENKVVYECKLLNGNSTISLSSYKSNIHNEIALIFKTESSICNSHQGINLMLDTAEKLNFDDVKVICDPEKNNIHSVYCTLILDQSLQEKFSKTEILEFNLGGIQVPVKFKEENENLKKMFIFCDTKK